MLTRRSRKESGVSSPSDEGRSSKAKKSPTPRRSKSKSVEKKTRIRSKSASKKGSTPLVVLERLSAEKKPAEKPKREYKRKKSVERVLLKSSTPTPVKEVISKKSSSFEEDKINNSKESTLLTRSMTSRLANDESDDEPILLNNTRITTIPVEFGGLFGNLILFLSLPILVILSKIALKTKGILIPFPRGYLRFANYYDQDVFLWSAAILLIQLFVSLIPLSKKTEGLQKDDSKRCYYRFSGFMNLIVGASIVGTMQYYDCPIKFILEIVIKKTVPHIVATVLFALVLSIVLSVKYRKNFSGSQNFFQKFFIGTSMNPTLGPIDVKLSLYRYSFLMTILFNYLIILDTLKNPVNIYLYFVTGLQIFFAVDKLIFEFNLLPSYYLQKEKIGYWTIIQQLLKPAINIIPVQILLAKNLPVNYYILGITSALFLFGYVCQRYSDFIKYKFETNSDSAIKSLGGRRITEYGPWLYVRYPSYIGTLIAHLALILPVIEPSVESLMSSWPVFLYALYYIVTLSHRCVRVTIDCRSQYGYAWDHTFAAKWNLIPKIF